MYIAIISAMAPVRAEVTAAKLTYGTLTQNQSSVALPQAYFSNQSNLCHYITGSEYWLFVHSPSDNNITGLSVDLDLTGTYLFFVPVVTPESGVTIDEIDTSTIPYHIEISWTPRALENTPMIKFMYGGDPEFQGYQIPQNVVFDRGDGNTVTGQGVWTFGGCCIDCYPCSVGLISENHVVVPIGSNTVIPFFWEYYCYLAGGFPLEVSDSEGWVTSWTPTSAGDIATCGMCFEPRHQGSISIHVPASVTPGSTNEVTITALNNSRTIILEADSPVPVKVSTWGAIKSLYK
jgi:hypothetical protein